MGRTGEEREGKKWCEYVLIKIKKKLDGVWWRMSLTLALRSSALTSSRNHFPLTELCLPKKCIHGCLVNICWRSILLLITSMNNIVIVVVLGTEFRDLRQSYLFIICMLTLVTWSASGGQWSTCGIPFSFHLMTPKNQTVSTLTQIANSNE